LNYNNFSDYHIFLSKHCLETQYSSSIQINKYCIKFPIINTILLIFFLTFI
jgi:hypothetical protein